MQRARRLIIGALVIYNGILAASNALLMVTWPDYQADQLTRADVFGGALINLVLLAALIYTYASEHMRSRKGGTGEDNISEK